MIDAEDIEFYDPKEEGQTWSVSSLKAIHSCGKQWYFRYRTDTPVVETPYLAFGKCVHKVIEEIHNQNNFTDAFWQPYWSDLWDEYSRDVNWDGFRKLTFNNRGAKMIAKYVDSNQGVVALNSELEFPPKGESFKIGEFPVRGKIDQIRRTDGGRLLVIDFKTAKYPPDPLVLDADPQFTLYYAFARKKYGEEPLLGLYHLESGKLFYTQRSDKDIEMVMTTLKEAKLKVDQELFSRNVGESCKWCPFVGVCLGNATDSSTRGIEEL